LTRVASAEVTPELQHAIREATFEVVMKKPEKDPVTYEKPLPLELLPYLERTDAYRSIGTAFSLGHNTYVTAAHVIGLGIGSQYGAPALRRADGSVFAIDRIVKYSIHEDYVVFSLRNDPSPAGFDIDREPRLDDQVLAVGNALGEGIVIRDGLFTSQTPEDQDGRWKWIRFSAAASPGNSGGPLLDAGGKVIGIVIGKSPNENLNYSLPITRVVDALPGKATFDQQTLITLPFLHGTYTYKYTDEFALPLDWERFVTGYRAVIARHDEESLDRLLKTYADTLFPKGPGAEDFLYGPDPNRFQPRFIAQQSDGTWGAPPLGFAPTALPGDGSVSVANFNGTIFLRLIRSDAAADDAFYGDSKAVMDLALKALNLRRAVGPDQVRVTSLGRAERDEIYQDPVGRRWQERVWAVPYLDGYVYGLMLPTPDGYAAIIALAPSSALPQVQSRLRLFAAQTDVSYEGTLPQWQAMLRRHALLPESLRPVKLEHTSTWSLATPRFRFAIPQDVLALTDKSRLRMTMGFSTDGARTVADIADVWWYQDERLDAGAGLYRRRQPSPTAKLELRNSFASMLDGRSPYDRVLDRQTGDTYAVSEVLRVPGKSKDMVSTSVLYGLTLNLVGHPTELMAQQLLARAAASAVIVESDSGTGAAPGPAPATSVPPPTSDVDAQYAELERSTLGSAAALDGTLGTDIRGRHLTEDLKDYLQALKVKFSAIAPGTDEAKALAAAQSQPLADLQAYWQVSPNLMHNRDLWAEFLTRNHLPAATPHAKPVVDAEAELLARLATGTPSQEWSTSASRLLKAYIDERKQLGRHVLLPDAPYRQRLTPCPTPAGTTSGGKEPKYAGAARPLADFWSADSRRLGEQGQVLVSLRISATGCVTAAAILASSGSAAMDDAVMQFYEVMSFLPAETDGKPVEVTRSVPIVFTLRSTAGAAGIQ
jgi:TonB family protein